MRSWDDMLSDLVRVVRARKVLEREEKILKEELILSHRMQQPDTNVFHVPVPEGTARVIVKQKTDMKIHKPDELLAVLGKKGSETLKPNPKLVWELLAKEPTLMARALAAGTISVSSITYVEVMAGDKEGEAQPASEVETRPQRTDQALPEKAIREVH